MNTQKLVDTIGKISNGDYPAKHEPFGGAHLLIADKAPKTYTEEDGHEYYRRIDDVHVVSSYTNELSWLVYQLKEVFWEELDYMNKIFFYPGLGDAMNEMLQKKSTLKEIMLYTVIQSVLFWIIPPEIPKKEEIIQDLIVEKAGSVPEPEDDGITIGQILKANEEGRSIAEERNKAMHDWMEKAMGKE